MKISVVTISFNQSEFLFECIQSIESQEGPYEHIIVDPGSTDGSRDIIVENSGKFTHCVFEEDSGPANGLNKGFSRADGDIYFYLNSDDVLLPGAFKEVREAFASMDDIDLVYGNGVIIDAAGNVSGKVRSAPFISEYIYHCGGGVVLQQATFFRAEAFQRIGGFNDANHACWDGELLVDFARAGCRMKHISRDWGAFRLHRDSLSGGSDAGVNERYQCERLRMFRDSYGRGRSSLDKLLGKSWRLINGIARYL